MFQIVSLSSELREKPDIEKEISIKYKMSSEIVNLASLARLYHNYLYSTQLTSQINTGLRLRMLMGSASYCNTCIYHVFIALHTVALKNTECCICQVILLLI